MSEINQTICTIYKDPELPHKTQYVMTAVRFRGKWVFVRARGSAQCQMIGGSVRNHETPEAALRRELYEKAVCARENEKKIYRWNRGVANGSDH